MPEDDDASKLPAKEIAKVVNNLANKLSKGAGIFYSPIHIKRMAKADAKAKIITAQAEQEVFDIAARAEARRQHEQIRQQENVESIIRDAIPGMKAEAKPEGMDDDWVTNFFDYAKNVSNARLADRLSS